MGARGTAVCSMYTPALLLAVIVLVAGLALIAWLLPGYLRRARVQRLWGAIRAQLEAKAISLAGRKELEGLNLHQNGVLTPEHTTFVQHARAGAVRVELAVGVDDYERFKQHPREGFRAHEGGDDLLGYVRKADYASILAERRRILEQEIPRVEAERQRFYKQCEIPCRVCDGSGNDDDGGACPSCGGVGQTINTAMLDNLPAMPQVPLPVNEVRVVFLYRA
jgi:hypothetical protein